MISKINHPQSTTALVEQAVPLTDDTVKLILIPKQYIDYAAGQYLKLIFRDKPEEPLLFSIANAALGAAGYELHIRHESDNRMHTRLFQAIKNRSKLTVRLPFGECHVEHLAPDKPIIFIAGGTGFAPIKSMIEHLLLTLDSRSFSLYWNARTARDFYMQAKVKSWKKHVRRFVLCDFLSESEAKSSLIARIITNDPGVIHGTTQIVLAGPFDMIYRMRDALVKLGVVKNNLFADAFSFE
ncbi:MAG: hypothetical protein A3F46_09570 [Legionellales bacterium RIFCSPHIGHO2_12_FULL_42_9]|nr:MAG: hypothetical protein A3F46_09570 [Legionellales bacterium RIFCSPHIGHO2_12_FULL_42_9]